MNKILYLLKSFITPAHIDPDDAYLAEAADLSDLERRMQQLDARRSDSLTFHAVSHG